MKTAPAVLALWLCAAVVGVDAAADTNLFAPPVYFNVGSVAGVGHLVETFALGDFDEDGRNDVVFSTRPAPPGTFGLKLFTNSMSPGVVSNSLKEALLINQESGRMAIVAVSDIDGDGKLDIVTRTGFETPSSRTDVFRNTGSLGAPGFSRVEVYSTNLGALNVTAVGDLDADGRTDLLGVDTNRVYHALRNVSVPGEVAFAAPVPIIAACCSLKEAPQVGDLDGDGRVEIVWIDPGGEQRVAIFRNLSAPGHLDTNSFAPFVRLPLSEGRNQLAIADLDRDSKLDLIVTAGCTNTVRVFRNVSTPGSITTNSFATPVDFLVGGAPLFLTVADFDGDGHPDLATGNCATNDVTCGATCGSNTLSVLRNRSLPGEIHSGSFSPPLVFAAGSSGARPVAGDLDNDGRPDLLVATYTGYYSVWRNALAPVCLSSPPGVVAWWPGDGNANDVAGANHGLLFGDASYAPGLVGSAFSLNGNGRVEIPHSPSLSFAPGSSMTLTLWAYRTVHYLPFHIVGKRDGCGGGIEWNYMIGIDGSVPDTPLNEWIHWALVFDGTGSHVYTNGSLYIEYPGETLGPENTVPLTIGTAGLCAGFSGLIDEVAIYSRALTPNDIAVLMQAGTAGMCKPAPLNVGVLGGGGVMRSPEKSRYDYGEGVTLTATNRPYYTFLRWSDGATGASRVVAAGAIDDLVAIFTNTVPLETLAFKQWDRSFGGGEFDSYPTVRHTLDGGYVLAGSTSSGADGNKTTPLCGTTAAWIVKLDAEGNKQWEQTVGAPGDSLYVVTIELTGDGGYVLGASSAAEAGVVTGNCGKTSPNFGMADYWLVRLDSSGQRLWDRSFGGDNVDALAAIAVLEDGGFVLAGNSSSGAAGNKTSPHRGQKDCWVVRVDSSGNGLWDYSFGGSEDENALAVSLSGDGSLLVTGSSASGSDGNKTAPNRGLLDYWAIRLDANGNKLWDRSYGGGSNDIGGWMTPMPDGGAVLAGYSDSLIGGTRSATNFGGADYWLVRIDAAGNQLWDRSFGGSGEFDWAYNVRAAADGGVVIVGESDTDLDGNKTTGQIGNSDGWVVRLDPWGAKVNDVSLGGSDYDYIWSVDSAGADAFILAGGSYSAVDGNKSAPLWGNEDFWVVRMVERTAPVGTPIIAVDDRFVATNHVFVTNSASVSIKTTFPNGYVYHTQDGSPPGSGRVFSEPFVVNQSVTVRALAYNEDYTQAVEAEPVVITVVTSPSITLQPEGAIVRSGTDVVLLVDAAGPAPLDYQWTFNDSPIVGATSSFLIRANVQTTSAGNYRVIVSNPFGSTTSAVAELTVLVAPGITAQPSTTNVNYGDAVTFCVSVIGSGPMAFQWRKNGVNLAGQTNSCLVINPVGRADGGSYTVVVQNGLDAITSDPARLLLNVPAPISADQFVNATLLVTDIHGTVRGTNRLATSEAGEPSHGVGAGGRTVWYRFVPPAASGFTFDTIGSTFDTLLAIYTGSDVGSLTLVARDDDSGGFHTSTVGFTRTQSAYYIAIDGFGDESGEFILNWSADVNLPVIQTQPGSQAVAVGGTAIFNVGAVGTSTLSYQWQFNGADLISETNAQLVISNVQPANVGRYTVRVRNPGLGSVLSAPAVLEIGPVATLYSVDRVEEILNAFGGLAPFQPASGAASVSIGSLGIQILNTTNSTTSFRETNHCGVIGGASRWFKLKAGTNATFVMDTEGSAFNTVLAVYVGDPLLGGYPTKLIGCNDDAGPGPFWSRVAFAATNGIEYLIAVDGVGGASGPVILNWWLGNPPVVGSVPPTVQTPVAREGTNLTLLTTLTNGIPAPSLQWYRDQTLLANATNTTLVLNDVQLANAGTYGVVVSNAIGSLTSVVARLTVEVPLSLGVITVTEDGRTHVRVSGAASRGFVIQGTTNFANWIPIYTNPVAAQRVDFDDRSATSRVRRFYRAQPWP